MQYYFAIHWAIQKIFYHYDDRALILKCFLFLSNKNTKIWFEERSMGAYVAEILFLQVDDAFWLYWCLNYYSVVKLYTFLILAVLFSLPSIFSALPENSLFWSHFPASEYLRSASRTLSRVPTQDPGTVVLTSI